VVFVAANKVGFPGIKTTQVQENLYVVQPRFIVGNKIRYRLPVINEIYQSWLFRKLSRKYGAFRVINFDFTATRIYRFFKDVIFYYNDNLAAISERLNPGIISRYHKKVEASVAARARFCVSVTTLLADKLRIYNPASYEIPLGGPDIDDYGIRAGEVITKNKHIRVGLMGYISNYSISSDAVNHVLNQQEMELVMIGPVEDGFLDQLENRDRLVLKGTLTGKALFQEMNQFDVALAPYCSAITKDEKVGVGTGSKMYQYLALGKPVVISNMVGLNTISLPEKFLYIAKKDEEFPALIRKAHGENTTTAIHERNAYAMENTWEKRMENLIEIYNKS